MKLFNDACVVPQKSHTPLIVCYEPKGWWVFWLKIFVVEEILKRIKRVS